MSGEGWLQVMQRAVDARRAEIKCAVDTLMSGASEELALKIALHGKRLERDLCDEWQRTRDNEWARLQQVLRGFPEVADRVAADCEADPPSE